MSATASPISNVDISLDSSKIEYLRQVRLAVRNDLDKIRQEMRADRTLQFSRARAYADTLDLKYTQPKLALKHTIQEDMAKVRQKSNLERAIHFPREREAMKSLSDHQCASSKATASSTKMDPGCQYCTYRPPRRSPLSGFFPGHPCTCPISHPRRYASDWLSTPAEEAIWDYQRPIGGHPVRRTKVKFNPQVVTDVRFFERCE